MRKNQIRNGVPDTPVTEEIKNIGKFIRKNKFSSYFSE